MFTERDMRAAAKEMMARAANKLRAAGGSAHRAHTECGPDKRRENMGVKDLREMGHGTAPGSEPVAFP